MRRKDAFDRDALHFAPFLLLPSPFPAQEFVKALEIQPILNELMHKVAHDKEFLTNTLKETIKVDGFTKKLFDIYETVWAEGLTQVGQLLSIVGKILSLLIFSSKFGISARIWSV
jgi:glutathione synthase